MDSRRASRAVSDPKVRHVGFFTPGGTHSGPPASSLPALSDSPATNSLSPVMIPPPRHLSDIPARTAAVPVPDSAFRRTVSGDHVPIGSYNPTETLLGNSPVASSLPSDAGDGDMEFSEESEAAAAGGWHRRTNSGKLASSFPGGGFELTRATAKAADKPAPSTKGRESKKPMDVAGKSGVARASEDQNEFDTASKTSKPKPSKAERRALQEAQRAAKAASKGGKSSVAAPTKPAKEPSQKRDTVPSIAPSLIASEKKVVDRVADKDRKKDAVPPPRMQFDDKIRVEKAKKRATFHRTEARNRVELFRHLPQYERGTQLPDLEAKFFQLEAMHPAIYKVGLQYLSGDISGGNGRCIAMLQAFQEAIRDYSTPPEKTLSRDLTAKIGSYVSFFTECRPISISMGNAIRFIKGRIAKLSLSLSESEAKDSLCRDIDSFINEKIILADRVIVEHAASKVRDGDVLLVYGSSCVVEMILSHAHRLGKQFRVVIVDSRPKYEGQAALRRLVTEGLSCTYTHINAVSYVMHEVTKVFLGASSVLCNGTVYSRVGTASIAMVAHAFRVPVLICCEAYKFHERVQLDSICFNELGDSEAISTVPGRTDVNYLDNVKHKENLQFLNLMYDATPSAYVSMIITDYGMIPPTSVPVIVREYRKTQLWL